MHSPTVLLVFRQAVARANTCQCLKFAVRLWEAIDGVTVEVQRTKGCSFLFQETVKRILHAAETGTQLSAPEQRTFSRPVPPIPKADWEKSASEGVSMVSKSLQSQDRVDSQVLAVESLLELSKSPTCKSFCSKLVLSEDTFLLDTLVSLIVHRNLSSGREFSPVLQDDTRSMRRNAIHALVNCLNELPSCDLSSIFARCPQLTSPELLRSLLEDIEGATSKPHCAAAACRYLQVLCHDNVEARSIVSEVRDSIASVASGCYHEVLRMESTKLLQSL